MINETKEKMVQMKFKGMLKAFEEQLSCQNMVGLSFEERLEFLIDREFLERENQKLTARLRQAKLVQSANIEDVDYQIPRGFDKSSILSFSQCKWISEKRNIIITGATGTGKTFLASALAQKACRLGFNAVYYRLNRLFDELNVSKGEGSYVKFLDRLAKKDLLVIDDWGLNPFSETHRKDFFEIIEDSYNQKSLIIISQIPLNTWYELFGNSTAADAILDRIIHNSYKIQLKGHSMRKKFGLIHNLET